jgi:hypothetical protein
MKMFEVIELSNLYSSIKDNKMPLKTAYKFTTLMRKVEAEVKFYQSEFAKIVEEYGQKDENNQYIFSEDGQSITIVAGKENECNERLLELRNLDVEINDINFTIDELENFNLTIAELNCLLPLIKE